MEIGSTEESLGVCLNIIFLLQEGCNNIFIISKIQLVVYYQCCILIGWATTRLYVIAH